MLILPIQWDKSMASGVAEIDKQHKELIKWLNRLVAAMAEGKGTAEIEEVLLFISQYADRHFCDEEEYMEKYDCPVAVANKQAHARFMQNFNELNERFQREGASDALVITIQKNLSDWLVRHIRRIDTGLYPCVMKKDASQ